MCNISFMDTYLYECSLYCSPKKAGYFDSTRQAGLSNLLNLGCCLYLFYFFYIFFCKNAKTLSKKQMENIEPILPAFPPPILMICLVQIYYSFHQNFQSVCSHACQESCVLPVHFCTIMNLIREKKSVLEH